MCLSTNVKIWCTHKIHVHAQDSCACTRLLCMHNTLVHAQHSCACTTLLCPRAGPAAAFFWVPALVPDPSSACTRVLCMHKSVVHAQESCACTRILSMHNIPFSPSIIIKYCSETFLYETWDSLVHLHLHSRLRRIQ